MLKTIDVREALNLKKALFIDVRSKKEFDEGTIYGAINIPILNDEERAKVGTIYRNECSEKAILTGINFASSKLSIFYNRIKEYSKEYDHVIIFCFRGGMRSKSVCTFLETVNISGIHQLIGGYKNYRNFVVDFIENKIKNYQFIMLHGLTGVGKTHILESLESREKTVLDLEQLAKNRGSVFGNIGFCEKPTTQKMFETYIFNVLYNANTKYVFVESESKRIGCVQIPKNVYEQMLKGNHVLIKTTLENRVDIILKDYAEHLKEDDSKIKKPLNFLRKRLGNEVVDMLISKVDDKKYTYVIEYLIKYYYDPLYKYSIQKYEDYDVVIDYTDIEEAISVLVQYIENEHNY